MQKGKEIEQKYIRLGEINNTFFLGLMNKSNNVKITQIRNTTFH